MNPVAIYSDGGLAKSNPSPLGLAWSFVWVGPDGEVLRTATSFVRPAELGLTSVGNNLAEYLALLKALEGLPNGWRGTLYSDSQISLDRVSGRSRSTRGIPAGIVASMKSCLARLGQVNWVHVEGHPTKAELARGVGKGGSPVSVFNRMCDAMCRSSIEAALPSDEVQQFPAGNHQDEVHVDESLKGQV
jgi:ribonuclease HI